MRTTGLFLMLAMAGLGLSDSLAQVNATENRSESATVYIYRTKALLSSMRKYWVYANGKPLCKLGNYRHCQVSVPAGSVLFSTKLAGLTLVPKKRPGLPLTLEPGKTYYLQADLKTKALPPQAVLPLTEVVPNASKLEEIRHSKVAVGLSEASR